MWNKIDTVPNKQERFLAIDTCGFIVVAYKDNNNGKIYVSWSNDEFEDAYAWHRLPDFNDPQ